MQESIKYRATRRGKYEYHEGTNDPKLSSWQRVKEFKDEHLVVSNGKLKCDACRETISKKKSSVKKHVSSLKDV